MFWVGLLVGLLLGILFGMHLGVHFFKRSLDEETRRILGW